MLAKVITLLTSNVRVATVTQHMEPGLTTSSITKYDRERQSRYWKSRRDKLSIYVQQFPEKKGILELKFGEKSNIGKFGGEFIVFMTNQKCAVFGRHIKTFLLISQKCRRN
jgi:hypothetical protein